MKNSVIINDGKFGLTEERRRKSRAELVRNYQRNQLMAMAKSGLAHRNRNLAHHVEDGGQVLVSPPWDNLYN